MRATEEVPWNLAMDEEPWPLIAVCGGRGYADESKVREVLGEYVADRPVILTGGAPGADYLAESIAFELGLGVEVFPADWKRHGRKAGPIRNRQMLDCHPDLVIAFPGGKGTADMVAEAKRRGIPVREIQP